MSDWAELTGVVVGAGLGWFVSVTQTRSNRKVDRRKEIETVSTALLENAIRSWNAISRAAWSEVGVQDARERGLPVEELRKQSADAFAELREPAMLTALYQARLTILCSALADAADTLMRSSDRAIGSARDLEAGEKAHKEARAAFAAAVARQTQPKSK